jgi:hypothetical protein
MESNVIAITPVEPVAFLHVQDSSGTEVLRLSRDGRTVTLNKAYCTIEDDGDTLTIRVKTEGEA